jgi:Leucine Rich repeat
MQYENVLFFFPSPQPMYTRKSTAASEKIQAQTTTKHQQIQQSKQKTAEMTDIQPMQQPTTTTGPGGRRRTVLIPVTHIVSAPGGSGMIQELSFAGNASIMHDLETLRIFLRSAPFRTIKTLTLSSCDIGDDGLHALVEALADAAQYHLDQHSVSSIALERLDLSNNRISCNALVEDVARLVRLLPRLVTLDLSTTLSDILVDDEKTRAFVQQHFQNTSTLLERLVLQSHDADALFCVEYAVQTTVERNRNLLFQKSKAVAEPPVKVAAPPPPPPAAAAAADQQLA